MMLWIGRLILRHYIRNKKHKYGIKFYELCESGGIVMNVKIYSGEPTPDIHWLGQTGVIVLNLMENFLGKGYQLYIVTSIIHLNKQSTCSHIGGTLRSDRKSNPKEVMRAKLKKGDVVSRSRDGVIASKWKDKRDVLMINNMHTHEMVGVLNKRGEKKMKPNIIRDYNEGMSGIDLADQMVSYYESLRKTTRWYKNIALHIFYIFLFNALCLSFKYGVDKSFNLLKFRETIITDLIGDSFKEICRNKTSNTSDADYLAAVPPNEKKKIADKTMKR